MLLLLQNLFQKIQLTYSSLTIEQEYKKVRQLHLKGFFRIVVSVICFVSVSLIITNSLDENYWPIIPPSIWILVCSILWIFYNRLQRQMDYLLFILYLTYCGICLYLLKDPSLPTVSNVYFYQGYSYGIFEKVVTVRLPNFSFRFILSLMSFALRMYLYPVHETFPLILQVLMFVFSLATDYWHEKEGRSVFQDCYNYREELTKFQTLIASNLPAKILILSADLKEILFKNEGLLRTIKKFGSQAKNTTDLQLLTDWLEQLKVDTDNLNEETKHVIASQDGKAKNDNLFNLLKIIQSSQNLISKDQQKFRLHAEHYNKFTNTKKVFETIVFPLTWDSKNAIALILNDITQNYQNLTLKVADVNKNKMLAMISHELKTPLNGILGVVNILKKEINESHLLQYLSICKNSGELLLNLVNSILDLQKIRDNKFILRPSKDDLHQLLMDIYDLFKFQFDQKNLTLELQIDTQVPEVIVTDQNRLRQILINLIGNALKFTFRGGVAIAVSLDPNQKGYVHFKVSDSGIGIKDSDMKKLFKMYGRLDQPDPSVNTQGTGFGLEISDQLARLLSGDMESGGIKVESKEGTGTTFSFSIKDNYDHEHDNDSCYDSEMKYYEPGIFEEDIEDLSVKMSPYSSPSYAIYSEKTLIPRNSKLHDLNFRFISESEAVKSLKSESFEMSIGNEYFPQRRQNSKQAKTQVPSLYGRGLSLDQRILKSHLTYFERRNSHKPKSPNSTALLRQRSSIIAGKLRILLVDDNTFNLLIAKNLLENLNYGVDTALNGKLAIDEVLKAHSMEDFKICAILMDIQMPVMDGYEATKKLKQMMKQKEIPEIPIIAVSANDSEDDKKRSLEVGMHSHLSKPLNETTLRETLEEVLGSKILSDEITGGNQTCEEDNMESPKKGILTGLRKNTSIMMEKRIIKHSGESLEV